jgi:hypothetical protein
MSTMKLMLCAFLLIGSTALAQRVQAGNAGKISGSAPDVAIIEVLIDRSEPAYTVLYGISGNLQPAQREKILHEAKKEGRELVLWPAFRQNSEARFTSYLIKNEYPEIEVAKGMMQLLKTHPGTPLGLTWNGGIAFTSNDYQYAKKTYKNYQDNSATFKGTRAKDQRGDPVHPMNHLGPLLGW